MYVIVKRLIDIILSGIGIVILSPIFIIIAIAIKVESSGEIIFKQERLGKSGNVFKMYKFRSMCVGAEKGGVYSDKSDSRVTKVGKIIRATSLDELPQFINILKGDMSIIGPRPALTYHPWSYEEYTDQQKKMFDVRPGITGWAQINGRKEVEWNKRIQLNIWYVEHMSLKLDAYIFFKTIIQVVRMKDNENHEETVKKEN